MTATAPLAPLVRLPMLLAFGLVKAYQWTLSPVLGANCRFEPSCSAYAAEALQRHGLAKGLWLASRRVLRCHPWGACGYDPVPGQAPGPLSTPDKAGSRACRHHEPTPGEPARP